ncbi:MAG: VOC family protein [Thermoplasmata archaeon]|nr:VOC family protein [Thermoplasmata archaeon]
MAKKVKPIPKGYHALTPSLVVNGATDALSWYKKVFGGKVGVNLPAPDGKSVVHAEITIGDSIFFVSDEDPNLGARSPRTLGGTAGGIHVYTANADATFKKAIAAGAKSTMPPTDMFWGDRYAQFTDPFGHSWAVATHQEDVPPREMAKRAEAWAAQMVGGPQAP